MAARPGTTNTRPNRAAAAAASTDGDDSSDESWEGCGENPSFTAFSYGQTTEYHTDSRLTRHKVEAGEEESGYGGGGAGDEATTVVEAASQGRWVAGGGGGWVGEWGLQVPPATES